MGGAFTCLEMNLKCAMKHEWNMQDSYPLPRSRPKIQVPPATPEWAGERIHQNFGVSQHPCKRECGLAGLGGRCVYVFRDESMNCEQKAGLDMNRKCWNERWTTRINIAQCSMLTGERIPNIASFAGGPRICKIQF